MNFDNLNRTPDVDADIHRDTQRSGTRSGGRFSLFTVPSHRAHPLEWWLKGPIHKCRAAPLAQFRSTCPAPPALLIPQ